MAFLTAFTKARRCSFSDHQSSITPSTTPDSTTAPARRATCRRNCGLVKSRHRKPPSAHPFTILPRSSRSHHSWFRGRKPLHASRYRISAIRMILGFNFNSALRFSCAFLTLSGLSASPRPRGSCPTLSRTSQLRARQGRAALSSREGLRL